MNVFEAFRQDGKLLIFKKSQFLSQTLEQVLNSAYLAPTGNNLPSREFIL